MDKRKERSRTGKWASDMSSCCQEEETEKTKKLWKDTQLQVIREMQIEPQWGTMKFCFVSIIVAKIECIIPRIAEDMVKEKFLCTDDWNINWYKILENTLKLSGNVEYV